jgi:hypothetical protein
MNSGFRTCVVFLVCLCVPAIVAAAEVEGYHVGVNGAYLPNVRQDTIRRWVRETGALAPRVGMRMDLFQKGMADHPDAWVKDAADAGGSAIAMLFNEHQQVTKPDGTKDEGCKPPEGLWEPVFDHGSDDAAPGAKINPKNEWAVFVAAMAERYDGDGNGDAAGSPVVSWYSIWNEPDWLGWPNRPKDRGDKTMRNWFGRDFGDLARLAFVSHRAARFAHPGAKVGMQLCFSESVGMLLDDTKHPLAENCDFIDYHAYGGKGSDDNCFRNDGIVPVWRQMKGEYERRNLPLPRFMCTESGVGGGTNGSEQERTQAEAVIKANVVGAAAGLVTVCWYALVDPSWENMGLIADASKLPGDGMGAEIRDAYIAMRTASALLNGVTSIEEIAAGDGAHAYRMRDRSGSELVVAWADDAKGAGTRARLMLPMKQGAWERLEWDFARQGAPKEKVGVTGSGLEIEVTTMPVFFRQAK